MQPEQPRLLDLLKRIDSLEPVGGMSDAEYSAWQAGVRDARDVVVRSFERTISADADLWWAKRWLAQYRSDGSGRVAAIQMNVRAKSVMAEKAS
jgi:hypothetical protein